jgi:hypothetical protein
MPKLECAPDTNAGQVPKLAHQPPDEYFPGLAAEFLVEMQQQRGIRAGGCDRPQLLGQGIDQRRHALWCDHRVRVPVEGDYDCESLVQSRIRDGLTDDLLMTEVYAIEETNRQAHFPGAWPQLGWTGDDAHPEYL